MENNPVSPISFASPSVSHCFGEVSSQDASSPQPRPVAPSAKAEAEARSLLLKRLRDVWRGTVDQTRHTQPDVLTALQPHSWQCYTYDTHCPIRPLPCRMSLLELFEEAQGTVLIWGTPETRGVVDSLAYQLLDRAQREEDQPVPIPIDLAAWHMRQPLAEWLSDVFFRQFHLPPLFGEKWVQTASLMLFFDLSSLAESDQLVRLNALNLFQRTHCLRCVGWSPRKTVWQIPFENMTQALLFSWQESSACTTR